VQGILLAAAITPDNTPHGYNLTFAFPEVMFIIVAVALYLRFRSPHKVPGQAAFALARQEDPAAQRTTVSSTLHEDGSAVAGPDGADEPEGQAQESEGGE
jgi:hypothetical protein